MKLKADAKTYRYAEQGFTDASRSYRMNTKQAMNTRRT